MHKLVPGALFSSQAAREVQLQIAESNGELPHAWDRLAEGFRKNDPDGSNLARLLSEDDVPKK